MSKLRRKKPKVKMRSYGSGEKLPVVKSGKDFYLADEKFDSKGHGKFVGQTTGKLEGPSKRAIKGKGKKSGNVRVSSKLEGGDPIFLEDTSPMKMKNDYSSMKSMGQAVARWTSPLSKKGSDPQAAANVKLGIEKPIPVGIRKPEDTPSYTGKTKNKKTKTTTEKKFKPLEKVEKRGPNIGVSTYKTDVNLPQFSDSVTLSTSKITTKEEADKSRERRDNERMQKAVELANASETLLKGKEKRKLAQHDRQAKRGSEESKLKRRTAATKGVQALGSLLADIGKENSEIKPVGVAAEKTSTKKPKDNKKTTTDLKDSDKVNLTFDEKA